MKKINTYNIFNIVTAIAVTMFFSCKNNINDVEQIGVLQNEPISVADSIDLKYTDSTRLVANLRSPKMLDFSNRDFAFSEFPKGIELHLYDKDGNKNKILSDYAIVYKETDLIDLRGNVIVITSKNDSLFTKQLFYDQNRKWTFTNNDFHWVSEDSDMYGTSFDSDSEFNEPEIIGMNGTQAIDN